jgi:hypothetical protein
MGPDSPVGCDDGVVCTEDTMGSSGCLHRPLHAQCPVGDYCDLTVGCTSGAPCEDADDCVEPDACVIAECEGATRTCTYEWLDGDGDGYVPEVCGGDDCNDASNDVFPGNPDVCNGRDDDCDGPVDNGPSCGADENGVTLACVEGICTCPNAYLTCGSIYDRECVAENDPRSCGSCGLCPEDSHCTAETEEGVQCECDAASETLCETFESGCFDLNNDNENCGACGNPCAAGAETRDCAAGKCVCELGEEACRVELGFGFMFTECTSDCDALCDDYEEDFPGVLEFCGLQPS